MTQSERALVWCELRELYTREEADRWLNLPHPQLDGRKASDCTFKEVMAVIDRMSSGAFL